MPITLDGTNGITTPTYGGADTSEYLVPVTQFKNRIINGAMTIDQRNAGASVTPTNGQYLVDRWQAWVGATASKYTAQQSSTAPTGFINSLKITSTSAFTPASGDLYGFAQVIEGLNCTDLGWGTANAKTVTLSFWVYSSIIGQFGGSIYNNGNSRFYPFSYTISATNTWQQISITIAGDTTGTWLTTNGRGMIVVWGTSTGSTYTGAAGSWGSTAYYNSTGSTNLLGTNGATFYITGVQLEVGSSATSFETRSYGTELGLCQRYFYKSYNQNIAVGSSDSDGQIVHTACASTMYVGHRWKQNMRTNPTVTFYSIVTAGGTYWNRFDDNTILTTLAQSPNPDGVRIQTSTNTDGQRYGGHIVADAEL